MAGSFSLGEAILGTGVDLSDLRTGLSKAEGESKAAFSRIGNIIDTALGTAIGIATTQLLPKLGEAWDFVTGKAFDAVAGYERLSASIQTLVAKEISRGQVVEKTSTMVRQLTEGEKAQLTELNEEYRLLQIKLEKQNTAIAAAAEKHGANSLAVEEATIKYTQMSRELESLGGKINSLQGAEGQLVSVIEKHRTGTMSLKDAMAQAGPRAQELLGWIQKLAIQSPFSQDGVADAFKTALAYGFTTKEAQRLTTAMIDFAAGTGANEGSMARIALALGQIRAKGKLAGGEMLQLTEAGLSVREILIESGKVAGLTAENFDKMQAKGLIPANLAIEAITESLEKDFAGAAKAQSGTLAGLKASLEDLTQVGLREFFTGTFTAIQPLMAAFVDKMSDPRFMAALSRMGGALGDSLLAILPTAERLGAAIDNIMGVFSYLVTNIQNGTDPLTMVGNLLVQAFGLKAGLEMKQTLMDLVTGWTNIQTTLSTVWAAVEPLLTQLWNILSVEGAKFIEHLRTAWNQLQPDLMATWAWVQANLLPLLGQLWVWFSTNLPPAIQTVADFVNGTLLPAVLNFSNWYRDTAGPALADLWEWFETTIPAAMQTLTDFWTGTLQPALNAGWAWMNGTLFPFLESLADVVDAVLGLAVRELTKAWENNLQPALKTVHGFFKENIEPVLQSVAKAVGEDLQPALETAQKFLDGAFKGALEMLSGMLESINRGLESATKWLGDLATAIRNIPNPPDVFTPGSPTPFERGLRGINLEMAKLSGVSVPNFASALGGLNIGGLELTSDAVDNSRTQNNTYQITAQYKYQDERTLRDEVRMMQLMNAAG